MTGRYSVGEMNVAVRPSVFKYLLAIEKYDKIFYADSDIRLFADLSELAGDPLDRPVLATQLRCATSAPSAPRLPSIRGCIDVLSAFLATVLSA